MVATLMLGLFGAAPASSQTVSNTASGSSNGIALDTAGATVTLLRAGTVAGSAVAEIAPPRVLAGSQNQAFTYSVAPVVGAGDLGFEAIEIALPSGLTDVSLTDVSVDGVGLAGACPTPGPGEFCGVVSGSTLTIDFGGPPLLGAPRVVVRFQADVPDLRGLVDFPSRLIFQSLSQAVAPGDADNNAGNSNVSAVDFYGPQGIVLDLEVLSDRETLLLGEIVTWSIPVRNLVDVAVDSVKVDVSIPAHFQYVPGTTLVDGAAAPDPMQAGAMTFVLGNTAARDDADGDGVLEPGEGGYRSVSFVTVAGAGAGEGVYVAEGVARDYCADCYLSAAASGAVRILEDPDFHSGTILGKVFHDANEDGVQGPEELGVPRARLVLDDGTIVTADQYGRFHVPQVSPGQRLLKLDVAALGPRARVVGEASRIVRVTPGMLAKATFPVVLETEVEYLGRVAVPGVALVSIADDRGIDVVGNVRTLSLVVNGKEVTTPRVDVRLDRKVADRIDLSRVTASAPVRFLTDITAIESPVRSWALTLADPSGEVVHHASGSGVPPAAIEWDGVPAVTVPSGVVANYQLELVLEGEVRVTSPRIPVGIVTGGDAELADVDLLSARPGTSWAEIGGESVEVDNLGRFRTTVSSPRGDRLAVRIEESSGRSVERGIPIPMIEIAERESRRVVADGADLGTELLGWTASTNEVTVNGRPVELGEDGAIAVTNGDTAASSTYAVLIRNRHGFSRIVNLHVDRSEFDESGARFVVDNAVPFLEVHLPPAAEPLETPIFRVSGRTEPGYRVFVQGEELAVSGDGRFAGAATLERSATEVEIVVEDPAGRTGRLVRDVAIAPTSRLFLLAFAEAEVGHLHATGRIDATGQDEANEFYHEARLAYFLHGTVRGRWLVQSAFDTGRGELNELFRDLGPDETERLLRNLDPDKHYPVYGDGSRVEYSESLGKFYLAISDEEMSALVGNFPVAFDEAELAAYRRTLYGAQLSYRTLDVTSNGSPVTNLLVFGADVDRVHVRNEIVATGGSLYYVSHEDVVEGSEQVALVVRDKNSGLVLQRDPQRRGVDYTVKYDEGRLHFRRPIASRRVAGSPIDQELLAGHPVEIEVDFEARSSDFQENAVGARGRHWINDHAAIGGTWVDDPQAAGSYEMKGVDGEVRYRGSRVVAEWADTRGSDARNYRSETGGLSFQEVSAPADQGSAWKVAAEVDAGTWIGQPGRLQVGGYHAELDEGFASGMRSLDRGVQRSGAHARLEVTPDQTVSLRHHREEQATVETRISALMWELDRELWDAAVEYQDRDHDGDATAGLGDSQVAAARVTHHVTEALDATVEHQQTLSGPDNAQTTLGVQYEVRPGVVLDVEGTEGDRGRSARGGAVVEMGDSRLYAREQISEDGAGNRTSTVLGAESLVGRSSRVYTEYQWDRSDASDRTVSLVGMQRTWEPQARLKIVLGGELSEVESGSAVSDRSAATGGISWSDEAGWIVSNRSEIRFETGDTRRRQYLTSNRVDLSLHPDVTLLGRLRISRTRDRDSGATDAAFDEGSVGVAYRPVRSDRFQGIAKFTHLRDRRPPLADLLRPDRTMDVVALEGAVDLTRRVQWTSKGAIRSLEEGLASGSSIHTRTYLGIQRIDYTVHAPYDLGLEYRVLHQREANDTLAGWLTEASRRFGDRIRLGTGFNFSDFSDDEFSMNDHSVSGWFVRLQGKY